MLGFLTLPLVALGLGAAMLGGSDADDQEGSEGSTDTSHGDGLDGKLDLLTPISADHATASDSDITQPPSITIENGIVEIEPVDGANIVAFEVHTSDGMGSDTKYETTLHFFLIPEDLALSHRDFEDFSPDDLIGGASPTLSDYFLALEEDGLRFLGAHSTGSAEITVSEDGAEVYLSDQRSDAVYLALGNPTPLWHTQISVTDGVLDDGALRVAEAEQGDKLVSLTPLSYTTSEMDEVITIDPASTQKVHIDSHDGYLSNDTIHTSLSAVPNVDALGYSPELQAGDSFWGADTTIVDVSTDDIARLTTHDGVIEPARANLFDPSDSLHFEFEDLEDYDFHLAIIDTEAGIGNLYDRTALIVQTKPGQELSAEQLRRLAISEDNTQSEASVISVVDLSYLRGPLNGVADLTSVEVNPTPNITSNIPWASETLLLRDGSTPSALPLVS